MVRISGKEFPWREGLTVAGLLKDLGDTYPYPAVRIGGTVISGPNFETAVVPDNSELFLIPLIAGG